MVAKDDVSKVPEEHLGYMDEKSPTSSPVKGATPNQSGKDNASRRTENVYVKPAELVKDSYTEQFPEKQTAEKNIPPHKNSFSH